MISECPKASLPARALGSWEFPGIGPWCSDILRSSPVTIPLPRATSRWHTLLPLHDFPFSHHPMDSRGSG